MLSKGNVQDGEVGCVELVFFLLNYSSYGDRGIK